MQNPPIFRLSKVCEPHGGGAGILGRTMSSASYLFCAALSRSSSDECSTWAVQERKTERRIRAHHSNRLWCSDDIYFPVSPSLSTNVESVWPGGGALRVAVIPGGDWGGRLETSITRAVCSPGGEVRHVVKFDRLLCIDAGVRESGGGWGGCCWWPVYRGVRAEPKCGAAER